tara:strand:- start:1287 stop:2327 length:1041 start_codon:yes stop_codon:yes gene_type:complete
MNFLQKGKLFQYFILFLFFLLILIYKKTLSQSTQQSPSVKVQSLIKKNLGNEINLTASIEANEKVNISSVVSEKIKLIKFQEGTIVKKNSILLELQNDEEKAILKQVKAELDESILNFDRAKKLRNEGNASQAMLDKRFKEKKKLEGKYEEILAKLNDLIIKAPFDGLISIKNFSEGAFLKPGDIITSIYDLEKVKVELNIPELYINKLKIKQKFSAKVSSINKTFTGTIYTKDPFVDKKTRTFKALGIIQKNENYILKPGMMTNVIIKLDTKPINMLAEGSIIHEDDETYVFSVNEKKLVSKKKVITGIRRNGLIQILSGVSKNELIVIEGTNKIRSGTKVKIEK